VKERAQKRKRENESVKKTNEEKGKMETES
jgi:hypothetical protein